MATEITCRRPPSVSDMKRSQISRLRSVPDRQPYIRAVLFSAIHYMGILATITTLAIFITEPSHLATRVMIACLGFTALSWLLAFFKRRTTHCPLCKGTPLLDAGAIPHKNAVRFFPLNHGVSATLSIIAAQKFRCMYCGTGFDILKEPSHLRGGGKMANGVDYTTYSSEDPS